MGGIGGSGSALRGLRITAGLSQKELARRSGVSVRALRYLEQGDVVRPHAASLSRLAAALGLTPQQLTERLAAAPGPAGAPAPVGVPVPGAVPESGSGQLRVDVLGPLVISRGGPAVPLTSPTLRALLGLLALQPGTPVAAGEIVDLLWPDRPPRTCLELVHGYAGRLRALLEPASPAGAPGHVLRRSGTGYRLDLGPEQLDLAEFDRLAEQGRAASAAGAAPSARQLFREAWALWRGPLPTAEDRLRDHPAALAVLRRRTALLLDWSDNALALARYAEVVGPLREACAAEPLHEGLAARLMLALAGDGQQAAALELHETVRRLLDAQLGVVPGPELRDAQLRVLRGRLPAAVRAAHRPVPPPAQLPAGTDAFTGRTRELAALDRLLPAPDAGGGAGVRVAVLAGMAGAGKTALAVHWAHRVRHRFPDGQLFVDLHGHSPSRPVPPLTALAGFLRALGLPDEPCEDEAQTAAAYRSRLAGKRFLVVLDNAADPEQVRPLLPTGAGSLALVTSRNRMTGLLAREGARLVPLDALDPAESLALLRRMLGRPRADAEPDAVAETGRLCAHLPLALRIAAANLAALPRHRVADYNAELAGNRLDALDADGDPATAVRGTFALSFRALEPAERRMFLRLGTAPGPDASTAAAAALAGMPPAEARGVLRRLTAQHLVHEPLPERFAMHDLVRLYAAEEAAAEEAAGGPEAAEGDAALARLARHHGTHLAAAAGRLYPHLLHLPTHEPAPVPGGTGPFPDDAAALGWLDAERAGLAALVPHLAERGHHRAAWELADLLTGYFVLRADRVHWRPVAEAARAAAEAAGDLTARAAAELHLGMIDLFQGQHPGAAAHQRAAADLAERSGWTQCQAVALNNLASCLWSGGEGTAEVVRCLERALVLHRSSGRVAGEAVTLANLGAAYADRGKEPVLGEAGHAALRLAIGHLDRALALHRRIGDRRNEADTLRVLAEAQRDAGDLPAALESARRALDLARRAEDARFEVNALSVLGTVHARGGDAERGLRHHARARELAETTDDPRLNAETHLALADTCARLGRTDAARLHLEDARRLARGIRSGMLERQCHRVASRLAVPVA